MPITITPQNNGGFVGPGLSLKLQTDFIGPLPSTNVWTVSITEPTEGPFLWEAQWRDQSNPAIVTPAIRDSRTTVMPRSDLVFADGSSTTVSVVIQPSGGGAAADSGTTTAPWSSTAGLANIVESQIAGKATLTPEQSTQLQQTWQSTAQVIPVDSTIPFDLGPLPPGEVISGVLPVPIFGLIVRVTVIDPALRPSTPDDDYWFTDLAVARIFRGTDLWMRVPVHTSSKMIPFFSDAITAALSTVTAATWVAQMSYQVSFRPGCAGTVTEMRFP